MVTTQNAAPVAPPISIEWARRTVLLADVFESTRLNDEFGREHAERWIAFVDDVRREVLPQRGGRWVKSTGDGFLIEFEHAPTAAASALDIQRRIGRANSELSTRAWIRLRIGVHAGEMAIADFDDIGVTVDLAQRLQALAQPGETIVSAEVRAALVEDVDGDFEDLGEFHFKNVETPLRAYRLGPAADLGSLGSVVDRRNASLRATVAVLPFECRVGFDPGDVLGMALAEEVIVHLSRVADLDVISGQSTRQLHGRVIGTGGVQRCLDADLLLSGGYRLHAEGVVLTIQLQDLRRGSVLLAERYETSTSQAFDPADPLAGRITQECARAIFRHAVDLSVREPVLGIESYALLFAAIGLMHRATARDFERAREMLLHLMARQGRYGIAEAWLAMWHVLRVVQGWAASADDERRQALEHVKRSLDVNPSNALALAIGGLVHAYLSKDLVTAGRMYQSALDDNPCEPLAWLFSATRHAYLGEGPQADEAGSMALRLSPIDPLRYFFESLAATAAAGSGNWQRAIDLSRRSIKSNRTHASTWRTLVYALMQAGHGDDARQAAQELMRIEPGLTVQGFRERFPGRDGPMVEPWARALKDAGIPD